MSFYSKSFVYDGIPSEQFNLSIANTGESSSSNQGSGAIEILEKYIVGRPKPYFYSIHYTSKLVFPVTIFSPDEIDAETISHIQYWLLDKRMYKQLAITQADMAHVYFNAIFTNAQLLKFGNIMYGFSADCVCDSQFSWTYPVTNTYTFSSPPSGSAITFYNDSHYQGYLYPTVNFTMNTTGGSMNIVNNSDSERIFAFSGLSANEVITVNNDLGIVESSTGARRLSGFNKAFLRFIPGFNNLEVSGNLSNLSITYQFARRLGG